MGEIYVYKSGISVDENLKTIFIKELSMEKLVWLIFAMVLLYEAFFKCYLRRIRWKKLRRFLRKHHSCHRVDYGSCICLLGVQVDVVPNNFLFEEGLYAIGKFWGKFDY